MPMYIPDEAVAAGTQSTAGTHNAAAASATAATTQRRSDTYRRPSQHPPQTLLELDLRLPAENLRGARDIRLADLRVVDRKRLVDDLAGRVGQPADGPGELQDRELVRVAKVHGIVLAALSEQDDPADQVVHVAEAPCLRAVAVDGQRLVRERLTDERRDRTPVVRPHSTPVGIKNSNDRRVHVLLAVVRHRQRLGVALRLVVDAARANRIDVP